MVRQDRECPGRAAGLQPSGVNEFAGRPGPMAARSGEKGRLTVCNRKSSFARLPSLVLALSALRQETSGFLLASLAGMSISLHPDAPQGRALDASRAAEAAPAAVPQPTKIRSRLFTKYVALFVAVVAVALLSNGIFEVFFYYREHKVALIRIQHEQAEAAAAKIEPVHQGDRKPARLDHATAMVGGVDRAAPLRCAAAVAPGAGDHRTGPGRFHRP